MLALVCDRGVRLVTDHPEPVRQSGEALIALRMAGICNTDLELSRGYMGFRGVLGHEFIGEVVECDDTRWLGRRVVADINAGCGTCADCRTAHGHHCATRTVLGILGRDGAMAERCSVPESCLVAVPDHVPDEQAVFAEPLAAALHVLDDLPNGASSVVVLGDGKLAQLVARALLSRGLRTIVIGHHPDKLELARRAGAEVLLEKDAGTDLTGVPVVVEATGSQTGLELALRITRPRGTLILKTTVAGPIQVDLSPVVINELCVVGSRCGDLERAIDALAKRDIDPSPLVALRFPLARADEAFERAGQRSTLKVLIEGERRSRVPASAE